MVGKGVWGGPTVGVGWESVDYGFHPKDNVFLNF